MKTMNKIFTKSNIRFKNTNYRTFEYDKFARIITKAANKAVVVDFSSIIPLNKEEIETLILSFPDDHAWYLKRAEDLDNCLKEALDYKVGTVILKKEDLNILIPWLDRIADSSEQIRLINCLIHWFGYKRESIRFDREFIPQDVGRGIYDGEEYCGSTPKEFLFAEPIHIEDEEQIDLEFAYSPLEEYVEN